MRPVQLYIATSLDGFIANPDGSVDWLFTDQEYGYSEFYSQIDCTLMGRKTYEQVLTFGPFPYPDKVNYVFSRDSARQDTEHVIFVSEPVERFVSQLKDEPGGPIWLIGGGSLNSALLTAGLIDEIVLSVHPVALGSGIPLFEGGERPHAFDLTGHTAYASGLIQLRYRKK